MSNQKKKQPVTPVVIEQLDSVMNALNELYGTETECDRMMEHPPHSVPPSFRALNSPHSARGCVKMMHPLCL